MNFLPNVLKSIILSYKKDLENEEICRKCDNPDEFCVVCKKGYCEHYYEYYYGDKCMTCSSCNELYCLDDCGKQCGECYEDLCNKCIGANTTCDKCFESKC